MKTKKRWRDGLWPRRRRVVEIVESTYQPSKAELAQEIDLPEMELEEAARRLLEPVEVRRVPRSRSE